MNRPSLLPIFSLAAVLLAISPAAFGVERFDDISVAPQSIVSGWTQHGYREMRVLLENLSPSQTHRVTIIYPDRAYTFGNSIRRLSRTVALGPASRANVPLWLPPLPANGNGSLRILVDDESVGSVSLPDVPRHMSRSGGRFGGSTSPATILVSRSLNYDELNRKLNSTRSGAAFSAAMATGAPDSGGRRGRVPTSWMPDSSRPGPHWLELDYDKPMPAKGVRIYETLSFPAGGAITLTGVSGTNLLTLPISGPTGPRRSGSVREFSFPETREPVKTVRLSFGPSAYAGSISIDAVELEGPSGSRWATSARASSEHSPRSAGYGGRPGSEPTQLLRAELGVADWSEYWLSYTPYDAVVFSAADLKSMPAAVQTALWRYTECGGNLVLFGGGDIPQPWQAMAASTVDGGRRYQVGFGCCFDFASDKITNLTSTAVKTVMESANNSARYWQTLPDESAANGSFPVVSDSRIPVRSTVFIMLAFVILIGPVNLLVLSRLKRRTWLLWTIPAISLVTCLMVFGYSLVREGVTPDVRTEGLTLLDQVNHRASTIGMTAFYCPLTPSDGLSFDFDTEATPLVEMWSYRYGSRVSSGGNPREVDWTRSQHLQRGWVTARVPAHFLLCKSELRRERLQLENTGGHPVVVNGLGATIQSLWLADKSGRIYIASKILAGQKAALSPDAATPKVTKALGARALFDQAGYSPADGTLTADAVSYLLPGTYLAELDSEPFLENGLGPKAKSARTRTRSVVYGILEP